MIQRNLVSGNSAQTNMMLLEILKLISGTFSTEVLASKVLPIMIPFLVNKSSTQNEFTQYLGSIKVFLEQIENKRKVVSVFIQFPFYSFRLEYLTYLLLGILVPRSPKYNDLGRA